MRAKHVSDPSRPPEPTEPAADADERLLDALLRERQAREQAEEALRLNETFAAILGHDLRNPLGAITTGAHYLILLNAGDRVSRAAARILTSSERMARMIDQLLDFTRIRIGGGLERHARQVDLVDLLARVTEELEAAHPEGSVALGGVESCLGVWDGDRLLQAFSNLIGNALQHGDPHKPVNVQLEVPGDGEPAVVTVHNAGCIPAELLPVLFEPFRRSSRQRKRDGLGLGLFITQQIVVAHGGTIEVDSDEQRGTTFRIQLPLAPV